MAGLYAPLPTLRRRPRGRLRTDRGRRGLLLLHRSGLSPHTPCQSPGALTCVTACPSLCLRLAHVVTSISPRLDFRWGGLTPCRCGNLTRWKRQAWPGAPQGEREITHQSTQILVQQCRGGDHERRLRGHLPPEAAAAVIARPARLRLGADL